MPSPTPIDQMTTSRRMPFLLALAAAAIFLLFGAGGAQAANTYMHTGTFDGGETPPEAFGSLSPAGLAINQDTGHLYAIDHGYSVVNIFDADGKYVGRFDGSDSPNEELWFREPMSVAVDNSGGPNDGNVYVANLGYNVVSVFSPSGEWLEDLDGSTTAAGSYNSPGGVTVDGFGNLYVADQYNAVIAKYAPTGEPVTDADLVSEISHPELVGPGSLAADAAGNLFVPNFHVNWVQFDASGNFVRSYSGFSREVAVNQGTGEVFYNEYGNVVVRNLAGVQLTSFATPGGSSYGVAVNETLKRVYVTNGDTGHMHYFDNVDVPRATTEPATDVRRTTATVNGVVNTDGVGDATCEFEYGTDTSYGQTAPCTPPGPFTDSADHQVSADLTGLSAETTYHYRVKAANADGPNYGVDMTFTTKAVLDLTTLPATDVEAYSATLHGSFDPDGDDTEWFFEYGVTDSYGSKSPLTPGVTPGVPTGTQAVSAAISGLKEATTYHYRIVASSPLGTSYGEDETLTTDPVPPAVTQYVTDVHSDSAILRATIVPGGGVTTYRFEWGAEPCSVSECTRVPAPDGALLELFKTEAVFRFVGGLEPGTTYYYRVVAENPAGQTVGSDRSFTTFPFTEVLEDPCPNAHARQQTSAALLLDCRAYELVSAADTGGYDVTSDLAPNQAPFGGYPDAGDPSRVLYSVVEGRIPGPGYPTNRGPDPYVATRGAEGWTTKYVGVPANDNPSQTPFGSPLLGSDASLATFAFGGAGICDPCFADESTNVPLRRRDGSLVKGMAGSLDPGPANPVGDVRRPFSADGRHFIFGSTEQFEPAGNSNGDVTIYDRDLEAGTTQVVSTLPNGTTMQGPGIAQLDISEDGSRIVVARQVGSDAAGNELWHPYLHVGGAVQSLDLAPGTSGVIYNGMTRDGSSIFFTTSDQLVGGDTDSSADIYVAQVDGTSIDLFQVSTGSGGTGNTDACDPVANTAFENWNSNDGASDCSAVAIAGGGGIARDSGAIYFLSPELLDGPNGIEDAPNLYLARPGSQPAYVTTLESALTGPAFTDGHLKRREIGPISGPRSVAIDRTGGDIYVLAGNAVRRYDSGGSAAPFSAAESYVNGSLLTGTPDGPFDFTHFANRAQVAVDSSGGPTDGYIYVTAYDASLESSVIHVFDDGGSHIGELPPIGFFGGNCGVAVDGDGNVYIGASAGGIQKLNPVDGNPANNVSEGTIGTFGTCDLAVDSSGDVYASIWFTGATTKFESTSFTGPVAETAIGGTGSTGVAIDPANDHLYVTRGKRVTHYDSSGAQIAEFGGGDISNALAAAVNDAGEILVADLGKRAVSVFGPIQSLPDPLVDNPAVVNGVRSPEAHRFGDFQVTPSGGHAVFVSTISLTGYDTAGFAEVYRHEAASGEIDCASCAPTGVQATGDAALATRGLSVSDDGRVFFNSTDELAPRDLNKKKDAYQWSEGTIELISTGSHPQDSSLLGISTDGVDAYFFTRQRIAKNDDNGDLVRIYDARSEGGFPQLPPRVPCQAADECHGPGSVKAPPPGISTFRGTLGNVREPEKCQRGTVRKGKRCVKACPKGKVRKGNRCVKKAAKAKRRAGKPKRKARRGLATGKGGRRG